MKTEGVSLKGSGERGGGREIGERGAGKDAESS